ncbi:MAG: DNA polymerase A family protein [Candidatus Liptonbacteria bacterium]|nr:DNA polymerase A family protein [Candidatus Liptonbacteria bacterium]
MLFGRLGIASKGLRKTPGGAISTDAETLERLSAAHPALAVILKYRELFKLKSTYIDALPMHADQSGRIHTIFDQTGTVTGRVSSEHPNLQNIPAQGDEYAKKIRSAFITEKGFTLVSFDYSQIELRIMASLSEDETMIETFRNKKDIHVTTASQVWGVPEGQVDAQMRRMAKTLNFGIIYGMGADAFAKVSGKSREEAREFIRKYFANFPRVKKFHEDTLAFGRAHGYVENRLGRRRWLPDLTSGHPRYRAAAERMAINFPLQSFDADIMKGAMIAIAKKFSSGGEWGNDIRMVLQVHDQLLFEIRDDILQARAGEIKKLMEAAGELAVPTAVDVHSGTSWGTLNRME